MSDQVVDGLKRGDTAAWRRVDAWIGQASASFRRKLGEDWRDTVQEVHIELLRLLRQDRFRAESSFRTYVWRVTCNTCIDRIRRRARRFTLPLEEAPEPEVPERETPTGALTRTERARLAFRVLMEMPENCRRLWRMILDGHSYSEMSQSLGVTPGTLRVRVYRCRERARELLERLERPWTSNDLRVAAPNTDEEVV